MSQIIKYPVKSQFSNSVRAQAAPLIETIDHYRRTRKCRQQVMFISQVGKAVKAQDLPKIKAMVGRELAATIFQIQMTI